MNRRALLKSLASAATIAMLPNSIWARPTARPDWSQLKRAVGGNLIAVPFPITDLVKLKNPYYTGDQPGLTQTLGWVDAWTTKPSMYAVKAQSAEDIAAAVNFARENALRVAIRGGGHSYQGTSNAADSLLIWTRAIDEVKIQGDTVKVGAGALWGRTYEAVTTKGASYVQGGGCTTVGVAGLIQSGGFGSFSKRYGLAASSLLEAEIVTADGHIRTLSTTHDADLFWALKGGGGGTFGVVTSVTLRLHDLPEYFGAAIASIACTSDAAYRRLLREFVSFYHEHLFNEHWGETVQIKPNNEFAIQMVAQGLDSSQISAVWKPFFDWIARAPRDYAIKSSPITLALPARHWWDVDFWRAHAPGAIASDPRPGHERDWWWAGDGGQAGWFMYGYKSLWLPASLLEEQSQEQLANALFAASRQFFYSLHFNKGLAGASREVMAAARDTAINPRAVSAFALAITADAQGPSYPGIPGHEPDVVAARRSAAAMRRCMDELRAVAPDGGSYVAESDYFEKTWQQSFWGDNYKRLASVKKRYDPHGLFDVHHGVGSKR